MNKMNKNSCPVQNFAVVVIDLYYINRYACVCVCLRKCMYIYKNFSLNVCECVILSPILLFSLSLPRSVCVRTNAKANGTEYDCGGCIFAFLHHQKIDNVNENKKRREKKYIYITHAYNNVSEFELRENRKRHFVWHRVNQIAHRRRRSRCRWERQMKCISPCIILRKRVSSYTLIEISVGHIIFNMYDVLYVRRPYSKCARTSNEAQSSSF